MKKKEIILLLIFLLLGFIFRLYRFSNPIADWFSWRQADTSAVSRNFVKNGFDILHPTYDDISNVQSGFDNPKGYRFVEFPIYNIFQAGLYKSVGVFSLEEWGRLVTIIFSLSGSAALFFLLLRRAKKEIAFFVLFFSLFLPYNIYYGRTILPDTAMVSTFLIGLYFLDIWLDKFRKKQNKQYWYFLILSLIFIASSFLLKIYTVFYSLTLIALVFSVLKFKMLRRWELWLYSIFALIPLVAWRLYIQHYPEGIPVSAWLFNGNGIRFRPAFFRWIFYERITKLIAGYFGIIPLLLGIKKTVEEKSEKLFLLSFGFSALLYVTVIATGNVQHEYYQIVIMPVIALYMGFGATYILGFLKRYVANQVALSIVFILIGLSLFFSWQQVKDYFNINNISVVIAGKAVDDLTPKNSKIVAPYNGDTTLLYYTNRKGWPSFEKPLPELVEMGADYLVLVNPQPKDFDIGKIYKISSATPDYILFDLHKKI